jgi:putative ABC transport system permease protein
VSVFKRLGGFLKRDQLDHELDEELRSHVDMRTADNQEAGMNSAEARRDARLRFGSVALAKEDTRKMDIVSWMEVLEQNVRYSWRMLKRSLVFSIVAVLTLALGIGANVATFSVVHAVLLHPLPFREPGQLVRIYDDLKGSNSRDVGLSAPELWDLRDRSAVFQDVSVVFPVDANLTGGDHPDRVAFMGTNSSYFTLLGVNAQLGRVYTKADDRPGFNELAVISDAFWSRMFGKDPNVVGRKIRLDGDLYSIVGVLPKGFRHPGASLDTDVDVWCGAEFNAPPFPVPPKRNLRFLPGAVGRLQAGLTVEQAQARLDRYVAELSSEYSTDYPQQVKWTVRLAPVQEDLVGNVRTELFVLFGAVGCVLLITCVNLANLLMARSAARQREIAVRQALGAARGRLVSQLLTESMLLSLISGVLAVVMLVWLKNWLISLAPASLPRMNEVHVSTAVALFAFGVTLVTGVLFGLAPALEYSRSNPSEDLREAARAGGASRKQMRVSRVLVMAEIALSLVLLIGAGLLLRSFWNLMQVRPGFDPRQLVTAKIWLPVPNDPSQDPYLKAEKRAAFLRESLRRVKALPGVDEAAIGDVSSLPIGGFRNQPTFAIENQADDSQAAPVFEFSSVSPEYFSVLRTGLLAGRLFQEADNDKSQRVAVVNEALARKYWHGADAIGHRVRFQGVPGQPNPWIEIVGIANDVRSDALDLPSAPHIYLSADQFPSRALVVLARSTADPEMLGSLIRREVQAVDSTIPVFNVRYMDEVVAAHLSQRRFALRLLGLFAGIALLLASIGTYGVMSYTFSQRTNEIGIRMALGARRADVVRLVLADSSVLIAVGLAAGIAGALVLTRFLQSMLFEVKPTDPFIFFAVTAVLAAVAGAASAIPARRAAKLEPLTALRHE